MTDQPIDTPFDMPAKGTWEQRGGWVCKRLSEDFDLTLEQAAGIVGNLGFESAGFTKLHEIGQPEGLGGYGWGQWTASRRRSFLAYCAHVSKDWRSDEANWGYLVLELDGPYGYCLDHLDTATTIEQAVFSFGRYYEAPGGTTDTHLPGFDGRLSYAKRAFKGAKA